MDEVQLEDLKQFIDGRVGQAEVRLEERIDGVESRIDGLETRLDKKIDNLGDEMLNGFTGVGEAIEEINNHIDEFSKTKSPA